MTAGLVRGFVPPEYPYDRLDGLKAVAARHEGGVVDLSVGTPTDPPAPSVMAALAGGGEGDTGGAARGYPPSIGTADLRSAIVGWTTDRFGVRLDPSMVAVCVGTKEFVASTPHYLHLRRPDRDTVLYPSVSYPTYEMGAVLAGLRAVPVAVRGGGLDLSSVDESDASRALMLWANSPANPTGALEDLAALVAWGARWDVPVFSDECYSEFTWTGPAATVLGQGAGPLGVDGVVAVHSLSKRSNLAGLRVGWYAGDPGLVGYLREVRKHAGMMVPGPAQRAAVAALADTEHVALQRRRYLERLESMRQLLGKVGVSAHMPEGGFYLWAPVGDEWEWTEWFASAAGALVAPGSLYGADGTGHVRLAAVAPLERLELVARRLGARRLGGDRLGGRRPGGRPPGAGG